MSPDQCIDYLVRDQRRQSPLRRPKPESAGTEARYPPRSQKSRMLNALPLPNELTLRPVTDADRGFMQELFASTRKHLLSLPLPQQQVDQLLEQQYRLQHSHYTLQWPDADTRIIEHAGKAIGSVTLDEGETGLHLIDIAFETSVRGRGLGTSILRALQAQAEKHGLPISLSVDRQNPRARKLYLALGFRVNGNSGTHESMQWQPTTAAITGNFHLPAFSQ